MGSSQDNSLEEKVKSFVQHKKALKLKVANNALPLIRILLKNVKWEDANRITLQNAFRETQRASWFRACLDEIW